jgi:hypothetical protein
MSLIQYVNEHLTTNIANGKKTTVDFEKLLEEFNGATEEDRKEALKMINAALLVEKLYMKYRFEYYEGGGKSANEKLYEKWVETEHSERIKKENPSKRDFINSIFNSQINSHYLSKCMLLPSTSLTPEERSGFTALKVMKEPLQSDYGVPPFPTRGYNGQLVEVKEPTRPLWDVVSVDNTLPKYKKFNNVLAATIAAEEITKPNELASIKHSLGYAIANTRRIAAFLTWFSTNTVKRIDTAKKYMPTSEDTQTVVDKLLFALNNPESGILAKLGKDNDTIAQDKKKVLGELSTVLEGVKEGNVSASDAFQSWKKAQNAESRLGKNRTALWGKTTTLEFMKDAEVALGHHTPNPAKAG